MPIPDLTLIGESINDSVPKTHTMFEAGDIQGIVDLAQFQVEKGSHYIDVNIGNRDPELMAEVIKAIQKKITLPLSIDSPDPTIAEAGLKAYKPECANNQIPILNSISEARQEMFDLYKIQPFKPILLITEGLDEAGDMVMNKTAEQIYGTAKSMMRLARQRIDEIKNSDVIFDPGIMPIGSDSKGDFRRLLKTLTLIHDDADLAGVNNSLGLSNFTTMLPSKKADGSPVRSPLESAFLTMAMPLGLNMIIGSVHRKYRLLDDDDPAMQCLKDVLQLEGLDAIMRVMSFFS